jgi:hypothetical protein
LMIILGYSAWQVVKACKVHPMSVYRFIMNQPLCEPTHQTVHRPVSTLASQLTQRPNETGHSPSSWSIGWTWQQSTFLWCLLVEVQFHCPTHRLHDIFPECQEIHAQVDGRSNTVGGTESVTCLVYDLVVLLVRCRGSSLLTIRAGLGGENGRGILIDLLHKRSLNSVCPWPSAHSVH